MTEYTPCIDEMLETLVEEGHIASGEELDAVGFKRGGSGQGPE